MAVYQLKRWVTKELTNSSKTFSFCPTSEVKTKGGTSWLLIQISQAP